MELKQLQTPCYIINKDEYINSIDKIMSAFNSRWNNNVIFAYSVKTNHLPYLMEIVKEYGWYSEVVSEDELEHSIDIGFAKDKIVLNGPSKMNAIKKQLEHQGIINIDNFDEIQLLIDNKDKIKSHIGLRISLALEQYLPGETTVKDEKERFGFSYDDGELEKAIDLLKKNDIGIDCIHLHHSTSSRSLGVYQVICNKILEIIKRYELNELKYIDIGGGYFGGNYFKGKPSIEEYAQTITGILNSQINSKEVTLVIEPGAAILATSCDYLTSVVNIKRRNDYSVVTVDGSCLHVNPFMKHRQQNPCTILNPGDLLSDELQIIAGSTCMEMDRLYPMDNKYYLKEDSKLLFHCAGAYTMTHNSNFINALPNVYVRVGEDEYVLIRKRDFHTMSL